MKTSSVLNWNSFGNRTAWLRLFMNTLARRCMVGFLLEPAPYSRSTRSRSRLRQPGRARDDRPDPDDAGERGDGGELDRGAQSKSASALTFFRDRFELRDRFEILS